MGHKHKKQKRPKRSPRTFQPKRQLVRNTYQSRSKSLNKRPKMSHDNLFKLFYSNPNLAQELFQLAFSKKEWEAYDWSKLKMA